MSSLIEKMQSVKVGKNDQSSVLTSSPFFNKKSMARTQVPIINTALSGELDGGLTSGLTFVAGESKNFKTLLGLIMVKAYMNEHPDSVCLFYDTEFGTTPPYVSAAGIDTDRVFHIPVEHLEHMKFDISKRLDAIDKGDKYIIFIDSIGNIASKKEIEDAMESKSAADMTRAKVMKSLWRIVTPSLTTKDLPCVAINHTYQTMELFSKAVMSGGTGGMYSANQVFIISKAKETEGSGAKTEIVGHKFTINVEKSRYVKEKSKFPFTVHYKGGINKWSGLFDLALEGGFIQPVSAQKYALADPNTGEVNSEEDFKRKETDTKAFWEPMLENAEFKEFVRSKYQLGSDDLIKEESQDAEDEEDQSE